MYSLRFDVKREYWRKGHFYELILAHHISFGNELFVVPRYYKINLFCVYKISCFFMKIHFFRGLLKSLIPKYIFTRTILEAYICWHLNSCLCWLTQFLKLIPNRYNMIPRYMYMGLGIMMVYKVDQYTMTYRQNWGTRLIKPLLRHQGSFYTLLRMWYTLIQQVWHLNYILP